MCRAVFALLISLAGGAPAAPPGTIHYFDEATNRQAVVSEGDFGKVTVVIRFVGGPGSFSRWYGEGTRKDNEINFTQTVGEGQERGAEFVGKASETKLEIAFKPKQRTPVDAGINGTYRYISEDRRVSIAKKEAGVADDALAQALKTVPRTWMSEDRSVAGEWKDRWPDLRSRWMKLVVKPSSPPASPAAKSPPAGAPAFGAKKPAQSTSPAPTADYWTALAETTGMGMAFMGQPLDKVTPGTDGEYDDGFGGHVSLRQGTDGFLRFTLTCNRGGGEGQTGELFGRIPAEQVVKDKSGGFTANYTHKDTELKPEDQQATVKLRKSGHFLVVETQYAARYCGRAWFDGIYRWSPVPKE